MKITTAHYLIFGLIMYLAVLGAIQTEHLINSEK